MYRQVLKILNNNKIYTLEQLATELSISVGRLEVLIKHLISYGVELKHPTTNTYQLSETIELLDAKIIKSLLINSLIELEILDIIDSTNKYAKARTNINGTLVCLAEYQTAGRGRQEHNWVSPYASGLCLSIKHDYTKLDRLEGLSIALAVTVARVLYHLGGIEIRLKWPNDVLWQQRKLAGLLLESKLGKKYEVVVGIGINIKMSKVDNISQPWVDLTTILQKIPSRNTLAAELINSCILTLLNYPKTGLNPFLEDWNFFDLSRGKLVTLRNNKEYIRGIATGIDEHGALIINNKSYVCGSLQLTSC